MDIDKILKLNNTDTGTLGMILSNKIDLMHNGRACISIDRWDELIDDLIKWKDKKITLDN